MNLEPRLYGLCDEYCHGRIDRREFLMRAAALAPDGLHPEGGYPGNDDRTLQVSLNQAKLLTDILDSARILKTHQLSNGKLGATGFCWGGGAVNYLATVLGADLNAGTDGRINSMWPAFEAALKASGIPHQMHMYPGTQHGLHNNSTPRYNEAAARLAWERTIAYLKKNLA